MDTLIEYLNKKAIDYKDSVERKKLYYIEKKVNRKIIIRGVEYSYFLFMYKCKKTGKRFVYYHDDLLLKMKRKKYYFDDVNRCLNDGLYERNYKKIDYQKTNKIPYYIYHYYFKKMRCEIIKNSMKIKVHNDIKIPVQIDIDDAYFFVQEKGEKNKIRARVALVHRSVKEKHKIENKTVIMQLSNTSKKRNELSQNRNFIETINNVLREHYHCSSTYISGDGAIFIDKINSKINGKRVLDKFHFFRFMYEVFGYSKTKNVLNKRIFSSIGNPFYCLKELFNKGEFDAFIEYIDKLIVWIKNEKNRVSKWLEIQKFKKFYLKNRQKIENIIVLKDYFGGCAETIIGHNLKRIISKKYALYNLDTIKFLIQKAHENESNLIII
ncbi:Mbov_0401 family ICE element transposase-like protein [Mycoplasma tauri]|uniref:Mbov_0401 family ICE element transposase-like protein n=1 Tax=Mycoplasma tauri TaxID=547987 RepID=UPI001CBFD7CA|nr:hypothetical protein [Mycoplasma tauri]MBZ4226983.1 hypothetical protein [Mycoplasma tauri]